MRINLVIKGTPTQAVDALNRHGIDSFGPVTATEHGESVTRVPQDYADQVVAWFIEDTGQGAAPIGTLLHWS